MNKALDAALFTVPARHNPRLQALVERINAEERSMALHEMEVA